MSAYVSKVVDVENVPAVNQGNPPWQVTGTVVSSPPSLTLMGEYDGNSLLIYFADALPGTLTSALSWRIRKLTYDGNGNFVSMGWANSLTTFSFSWDLRTSYTYA